MPLDFTLNDSTTQNCWQLSRATSRSSAARFGSTLEIRKRQPENNNKKRIDMRRPRGFFFFLSHFQMDFVMLAHQHFTTAFVP
jgi:hypothetical protein